MCHETDCLFVHIRCKSGCYTVSVELASSCLASCFSFRAPVALMHALGRQSGVTLFCGIAHTSQQLCLLELLLFSFALVTHSRTGTGCHMLLGVTPWIQRSHDVASSCLAACHSGARVSGSLPPPNPTEHARAAALLWGAAPAGVLHCFSTPSQQLCGCVSVFQGARKHPTHQASCAVLWYGQGLHCGSAWRVLAMQGALTATRSDALDA